MTEDQAKEKWCPFARLVTTEQDSSGMVTGAPAGHNRYSGLPKEVCLASLCIGSACMAWRWNPQPDLSEARAHLAADMKINAIKSLRAAIPSFGLKEAKEVIDGARPWPEIHAAGFCGLAGAMQ